MLRTLAQKTPLIVLTDSDGAGKLIRSHLTSVLPADQLIQLYVPRIEGKEKRKTKASADGNLGVEGIKDDVILKALEQVGVIGEPRENCKGKITKTDLYNLGLTGGEGSKQKRQQLLSKLGFPTFLSTDAMLELINSLYTLSEVQKWMEE